MLQLRLESFDNPRGLLADGRCCWNASGLSGGTRQRGASCRPFFTVCLAHYQRHNITTTSVVTTDMRHFNAGVHCTFGHATTPVYDRNSFDTTSAATNHSSSSPSSLSSLNFPFNFTWPVSRFHLRNVNSKLLYRCFVCCGQSCVMYIFYCSRLSNE